MIWSLTKARHYGMIWDYQAALGRAAEALRGRGGAALADEIERRAAATQDAIGAIEQGLKLSPEAKFRVQSEILGLTGEDFLNRANLGTELDQRGKTKNAIYAVCKRYMAKC